MRTKTILTNEFNNDLIVRKDPETNLFYVEVNNEVFAFTKDELREFILILQAENNRF